MGKLGAGILALVVAAALFGVAALLYYGLGDILYAYVVVIAGGLVMLAGFVLIGRATR